MTLVQNDLSKKLEESSRLSRGIFSHILRKYLSRKYLFNDYKIIAKHNVRYYFLSSKVPFRPLSYIFCRNEECISQNRYKRMRESRKNHEMLRKEI